MTVAGRGSGRAARCARPVKCRGRSDRLATVPTPTTSSAPPATPLGPDGDPVRQSGVLLLTTLGTMMVAIDSTIVILALPTMTRDLRASLETVIWTILAYLLIAAALTTQAGRVGDLLGRGRVYNVGFGVFTVGSALAGFSPNAEFLIGARVVQALGGAVMFANAGALIADVFPPHRRGRAFGFMTFGWSVGAILGILLGGVVTTLLGWRYIFFINIPIGIAAVALGYRLLPRSQRQRTRFDLPGFAVFSAALVLICYGAIEIASHGALAVYDAYVGAGLALLAVFVPLELRSPTPMLDLRQLRQRLLGFSLAASLLQSVGYLSVVFLLTLYLQGLRGLSPLDASLLLVPGYLVGAVVGPSMGRMVDKLGPRGIATAGIGCMCVAVAAYSQLTLTSYLGWIPVISLLSGVGVGMFFPANNTAIMSQARPATFGAVSGLRGTLSNLGTLLSYVLTLSIASAAVPRHVAQPVFLGYGTLAGSIGQQFLTGIHAALYGSVALLAVAAALSWSRGSSSNVRATGIPPTRANPEK